MSESMYVEYPEQVVRGMGSNCSMAQVPFWGDENVLRLERLWLRNSLSVLNATLK